MTLPPQQVNAGLPAVEALSDEDLVRIAQSESQSRAGREARATIVLRYHPKWEKAAAWHLRTDGKDPRDARAVANATAVAVMDGLSSFSYSGQDALARWSYTINRRIAKKHGVTPKLPERESEVLGVSLAQGGRTVERQVLERERLEALQGALEALTARQRQIMSLILEGYRVSEVATELGLTSKNVSQTKYNAMQALRAQMACTAV